MKTASFKKATTTTTVIAALAAATAATTVNPANAGDGKFWRGVGAGFVTGVIVNEAVRNRRERVVIVEREPRYSRRSAWEAHVDWCYDKYNSYSHVTDTYFIRRGVERQCRSPYL